MKKIENSDPNRAVSTNLLGIEHIENQASLYYNSKSNTHYIKYIVKYITF